MTPYLSAGISMHIRCSSLRAIGSLYEDYATDADWEKATDIIMASYGRIEDYHDAQAQKIEADKAKTVKESEEQKEKSGKDPK
jgi:hypothetical protein